MSAPSAAHPDRVGKMLFIPSGDEVTSFVPLQTALMICSSTVLAKVLIQTGEEWLNDSRYHRLQLNRRLQRLLPEFIQRLIDQHPSLLFLASAWVLHFEHSMVHLSGKSLGPLTIATGMTILSARHIVALESQQIEADEEARLSFRALIAFLGSYLFWSAVASRAVIK